PYHSTFSFSRRSDPFDYDIDRRPQTVRTSHRHTVFAPARVGRATNVTSVLSAGSTLKAAGVLFERQTTSLPLSLATYCAGNCAKYAGTRDLDVAGIGWLVPKVGRVRRVVPLDGSRAIEDMMECVTQEAIRRVHTRHDQQSRASHSGQHR